MASATPPNPATCQSTFEQGVALSLNLWPALTLAVQNNWGGPDSSDKRDWFAGAVVELFPDVSRLTPAQLQSKTTTSTTSSSSSQPTQPSAATAAAQNGSTSSNAVVEEPDQEDVETVLLQVMLDEFEVNVDDDSAFEVAEQVVRMRGECLRGKFDEVDALRRRWEGKKGGNNKVVFKKVEDQDEDTDWDTDDDDEEEEEDEGDVEMGDAPPPPRREREEPEVDADGFTTVSRKKR
ncbi:Pre-rRNA-processing protein TSR2-domain-containing protein [Chaetomidium leptoderma]|uniref:Pre-rRNA-processing protein TSR2-domain-containing protein n=1 Tax=Chaetomidium leptoderma TaxID=669021 RepID=A0AAN6VN64_9PEZI|nr:Pre-rRNA-processing protein TSR2-domain-containing protein [Chaetomidium leptoderma]